MDDSTGVAMKFWLACFALLFVGAELLQWLAQLGGGQAPGLWLIGGGLGLAAASNAAHLPRLGGQPKGDSPEIDRTQTQAAHKPAASEAKPKQASVAEQSTEDSISFKVRLPWR